MNKFFVDFKCKFKNMTSNEKLNNSFIIICLCFIFILFLGNIITSGKFLDSVLFIDKLDSGNDFFNSVLSVSNRKPYTEYGIIYPPLSCVYFYMFYKSMPNYLKELYTSNSYARTGNDMRLMQGIMIPYLIMLIITISLIGILIYNKINGKKSTKISFVLIILLSSGFLYEYDRGNSVISALFFAMVFVFFYKSNNKIYKEISLISLAISVGLKLYPVLLGLLLLKNKMWKETVRTIIYGLICFFVPLIFFEGFTGLKIFMENTLFSKYNTDDVGRMNLQSIVRTVLTMLHLYNPEHMGIIGKFLTFIALIGILLSIFIKDEWKSVLFLTSIIITNSGVSVVYMLSFISIPLVLFFNSKKEISFNSIFYLICFMLLVFPCPLPESKYIMNLGAGVRFATINFVQQMTLLVMLCYLYYEGTKSLVFKFKNKKNEID